MLTQKPLFCSTADETRRALFGPSGFIRWARPTFSWVGGLGPRYQAGTGVGPQYQASGGEANSETAGTPHMSTKFIIASVLFICIL